MLRLSRSDAPRVQVRHDYFAVIIAADDACTVADGREDDPVIHRPPQVAVRLGKREGLPADYETEVCPRRSAPTIQPLAAIARVRATKETVALRNSLMSSSSRS